MAASRIPTLIPGWSRGERREANGAAVAPGVATPRIPEGGVVDTAGVAGCGTAEAPDDEGGVRCAGVDLPDGAGVRVGIGGGVTTGQVPAVMEAADRHRFGKS